jgi:hypothetical protein
MRRSSSILSDGMTFLTSHSGGLTTQLPVVWAVIHRLALVGQGLVRPAPDGGREQHQPIDRGRIGSGHGGDGQAAAHADPGQGDLGVRVPLADQVDAGADILDDHVRRRPDAALGRAAKASDVEGVGRDPLPGPPVGGQMEGVGIVVHAVQADDHPLRLPRRQPAHQAQPDAVEADEVVAVKRGPRKPSGPSSRIAGSAARRRQAGGRSGEDQGATVHDPRMPATRRRR